MPPSHTADIASLDSDAFMPYRRQMQMIFQDPFTSLNPRKTILEIVSEPMRIHGLASGKALRTRVEELLELVGLRAEYVMRYPHAFSGGQRQRIGIARALALNPQFIVADEPVSALDVSVQAQVLNLMRSLQRQLGLTYLFISHDLSVVKHVSDRIAVMYVGNLVETAATKELFTRRCTPTLKRCSPPCPSPTRGAAPAQNPGGRSRRSGPSAARLSFSPALPLRPVPLLPGAARAA